MDVAARDVEAHVALLNEHQYNHDDSDGTTCSSDDEFEYGLEPPVTAADRPIGDLDLERGDGDDVQVKEAVSDIDGETSAAREEEHRHRDAAASETEDEYHFEKTVVSPGQGIREAQVCGNPGQRALQPRPDPVPGILRAGIRGRPCRPVRELLKPEQAM